MRAGSIFVLLLSGATWGPSAVAQESLAECATGDAVCVGRVLNRVIIERIEGLQPLQPGATMMAPPPDEPKTVTGVIAPAGQGQEKAVEECGGAMHLKVTGAENTVGQFQCGKEVIQCVVVRNNECTANGRAREKGPGRCAVAATAAAPGAAYCTSSE